MTDGERTDAPVGDDCGERFEDEAALREPWVGDGQRARVELAPAPQRKIEVEHARTPAAAGAAAEFALHRLEARKHLRGFKLAFDERHGIGEVAPSAAVGGI